MFKHAWGRCLAAAIIAAAPAFAGDYDRVFDVVKEAWPERTVALAVCNKDANQMALLDLADIAKAKGISLVIIDLKDEKDYNKTIALALGREPLPGFVLVMDEDPLLGAKGSHTARWIYRAHSKGIPAVGISAAVLKHGADLVAPPSEKEPVKVHKAELEKLKLAVPAKAVDAK